MRLRSLLLLAAALEGSVVACGSPPAAPPPAAEQPSEQGLSTTEQQALAALGYLEGVQDAGDTQGVTVHDPQRAQPGTNLVVSSSTWDLELFDMDGTLLHTWTLPDTVVQTVSQESWRRAFPIGDQGDLLGIVEGDVLVRLDAASNVRWLARDHNHHDVHIAADGTLWSLARTAHDTWPGFPDIEPVVEDQIAVYDAETGTRTRLISILQAVLDSPYEALIAELRFHEGDVLHTNSLEILDGRAAAGNPAFAEGNLLLSVRELSVLLVLDPDTERIVWASKGPFKEQHDAEILADGSLQVFDNHPPVGPSRVLRLDPADLSVRWRHGPRDGDGAFYTRRCGTAELLEGGTTLVVASNAGLAFEMTPDGERVWEFHQPRRVGKKKRKVANLFDVVRLPPADELTWLD